MITKTIQIQTNDEETAKALIAAFQELQETVVQKGKGHLLGKLAEKLRNNKNVIVAMLK